MYRKFVILLTDWVHWKTWYWYPKFLANISLPSSGDYDQSHADVTKVFVNQLQILRSESIVANTDIYLQLTSLTIRYLLFMAK